MSTTRKTKVGKKIKVVAKKRTVRKVKVKSDPFTTLHRFMTKLRDYFFI